MNETLSTDTLEQRMRPGSYSDAGFLGAQESLTEVLSADQRTLADLGLTTHQLADALAAILAEARDQRHTLLMQDYPQYSSREKGANAFFDAATLPHLSLERLASGPLPDLTTGYSAAPHYQVFFLQSRGLQDCPWDDTRESWSSFEFLLLNRATGAAIVGPGLIVHLIREHGFFEGRESPYRVDPVQLAQVLELAPSAGGPALRPRFR